MADTMRASLLLVTSVESISLAPAIAQAGFFESLFGLAPAPVAAPAQAPAGAQSGPARATPP